MKKIYTIAALLATCSVMNAQSSFSDDFESYNVGDYIGAVSPNWTTWDGITGGTEDTQVNNTMNNTAGGSKSCYWTSSSSTGGPQDCVLPFGGQYTTGMLTYQMDMYVENGKGAYFNFQGHTTLGQSFPMECYMRQTGSFVCSNTAGTLLTGTYPTAQWFTLRYDIDLNGNNWNMYINNVLTGSFSNTKDSIAGIDIFAYNGGAGGNNLAGFYVDNVSYSYTPYTLPTLNAAPIFVGTNVCNMALGVVGATKYPVVTVRNLGTTAITSFDLTQTYNSISYTQSFSGQNIASLNVKSFAMNQPITMVMGTMPLTVTISNVNGAGPDNDAADDVKIIDITPAVPAPGKVVVGEEATGTWCPWCVRGTTFMDYMGDTYEGGAYWAGIAVHNGDPMTVPYYDSIMGTHVTGYPSLLVDRGTAIDPSGAEPAFLSRVVVTPKAVITNGAQWNATNDTLEVSLTYTFANAMTGTGYKVACVLTEDSVTGTGSSWSQNNAYAGGGNGAMGGFESLPNPVSYTLMHYDHVARAISPSWNGFAGFPTSITASYVQTFTFKFAVPASWDDTRMHIIGMLNTPTNTIDNGSLTTVTQALLNGYQSGTGVGIAQHFSGPDAIGVYPNPSTNGMSYADVQLSTPQVVTLTVTDIAGKVVAQRNYGELNGANQLPINTSGFAAGVYTVQVITGSTISTSKLIVE